MKHIRIEIDTDGIALLTLDRPKVNAMSGEFLAEMRDAFHELAADDKARGVLVRGEGKSFSAGLDLNELMGLQGEDVTQFLQLVDDGFDAAFRFPKPMAAAVHGHAIAGGLVLGLCADHLVLGEGSYKLGLTELAVGVPLPRVAFEVVRSAVDERAMRKLLLGAGLHPPDEVFKMGVGDVLAADPFSQAQSWLKTACSRHGGAFRFSKAARRREACERIDALAANERAELQRTLIAAREAASGS